MQSLVKKNVTEKKGNYWKKKKQFTTTSPLPPRPNKKKYVSIAFSTTEYLHPATVNKNCPPPQSTTITPFYIKQVSSITIATEWTWLDLSNWWNEKCDLRIGVIEIERKRECLHYNRSLQISWVIIGKREGSTNFIIFITWSIKFRKCTAEIWSDWRWELERAPTTWKLNSWKISSSDDDLIAGARKVM